MAISKDKKQALVAEMSELFASAKAIAVAKYQGTSVAELQELRKAARENGVLAQSAADVGALAGLPSKNQLIAEAVAQLLSPVHDVTNALSGNLHALLDGVADKATA